MEDTIIRCFNQVFRPKEMTVRHEGQGDCPTCQTHEDNRNCSRYQPVKITIYGFTVTNEKATNPSGSNTAS